MPIVFKVLINNLFTRQPNKAIVSREQDRDCERKDKYIENKTINVVLLEAYRLIHMVKQPFFGSIGK